LLNRENATLEALAETLFRHYFIENPDPTWKEGKIADLVDFNPSRKLTKNEDSPYIEMANIETQGYAPSSWRMRPFASGTKFINGDAIMARISPCLENGKAAYIDFLEDGQVGWGSTEFLVMRSKMGLHPFFAYIMTRYDDFRDHAVSSLVGSSGRQRVDLGNLLKYSMFIPDEKSIASFNREMEMIVPKMRNNQLQMRTLSAQRATLLPRLMTGEVKV
jgi:type I restriction enzyme S subunit